jgi:uncharacterized protein YukE
MSRILINPDEVDAVAKEFQAKREQSQQFIHSFDSKIQGLPIADPGRSSVR